MAMITECNHIAGIRICGMCMKENRLELLEKENQQLKKMLELARDEYIEANWDGETDCVTPYDLYKGGLT